MELKGILYPPSWPKWHHVYNLASELDFLSLVHFQLQLKERATFAFSVELYFYPSEKELKYSLHQSV